MSVQKMNNHFLKKSGFPFTTILNTTINLILDPGALGIYVYLASKPDNWVIQPKEIMKHFNIGEDYLKKRFKILRELKLLSKFAHKNAKGQTERWETILYASPYENLHDQRMENHKGENPPCGGTPPLQIKEYIQKKELITISETVQNPSSEQMPPCDSYESPAIAKKPEPSPSIQLKRDLIDTYHDIFPENPRHMTRHIAKDLNQLLDAFIREYPNINPDGLPLTKERFKTYLETIRKRYAQWSTGSYKTESGHVKKNNLTTFIRLTNVGKILEGRMNG